MRKRYDLAIVGGGPAGYIGAVTAAELGKSVVLIEERELGGTCLNRGCVPTKALLHSAKAYFDAADASELGVKIEGLCFDYERMTARKNETVEKLRAGIELLMKQNAIDTVYGKAAITAADTVEVNGEKITADRILVATGSRPSVIPIDGADNGGVLTSDGLLEKTSVPEKLVIIGGGVIGVEFASLFSMLGSGVSVIEAADRILPSLDAELSRSVAMLLKKRGVSIAVGASVKKIEKNGKELSCAYEEKGEQRTAAGDTVLLSVGRRPNTDGLFKNGFSPALERGYIVADENGRTSEPTIYAAGDVVFGMTQLAHAASCLATNAVLSMFGCEPRFDMSAIPSCIYTSPETACVGLTEKQAAEKGIETISGKFVMGANARTVIETKERCFIKVVFDKQTEKLVGAQLMCERATDLISELTAAIANGLTAKELLRAVRPHPTFAEGITQAVAAALCR